MPSKQFQTVWEQAGFQAETAIQTAVYQPLKQDHSILGLAPTGSGKTLAFALPLFEKLVPGDGLQLLILAPSQELVMQERDALRPYAKAVDLKIQGVAGGANIKRQIERLKQKPEVIVATAGRLLELASQHKIKFHTLQTIVIDEADQQLLPEKMDVTRDVVRHSPSETQLAFFSATKIRVMDDLEKWFGLPIETIDVRAEDHSQGSVCHGMIDVPVRKRVDALRRLSHVPNFYALVFFNSLNDLKDAAEVLQHQHVSCRVLTSELTQIKRQQALRAFRKQEVRLLLTTDVAARGLDIPALPAVVNYDQPRDLETYIHRTGRTGRMGESGYAISLGNEHQMRQLKQLVGKHYQILQLYLTQGQLQLTPPERRPQVATQAMHHKPKATKKPHAAHRAQPVPEQKPKKKKRKRDQKNKGKRTTK